MDPRLDGVMSERGKYGDPVLSMYHQISLFPLMPQDHDSNQASWKSIRSIAVLLDGVEHASKT